MELVLAIVGSVFGLVGLVVSFISIRIALRADRRDQARHEHERGDRELEDAKFAMWTEATKVAQELVERDGGSVVKQIPWSLDSECEKLAGNALIAEGRAHMQGDLLIIEVDTRPRFAS